MAVYVNNFTIETGAYFSRDFYLDNSDGTSLNLTGYSAKSHLRKHPESVNATSIFNVGFINREDGHIRVSLATTATKEIKPGRYVYDVLFTDPSDKKSIVIEGQVLATQDISPQLVIINYDNEQVGVINENSAGVITYDQVSSYGVVHIGVTYNQCSGFSSSYPEDNPPVISGHLLDDLRDTSNGKLDKLKTYMNNGGVVWFNGEWWNGSANGNSCSHKDNINEILTLLESEIRAVDDLGYQGNSELSSNTVVQNSGLPATQTQDATVIFTGGTPVYVTRASYGESPPLTITAYEKIGSGILYVSGDSNTAFNYGYEGYEKNIYNGLRYLVINS